MKAIRLTQGYLTFVSDEDHSRLSKHKWYAEIGKQTIYAARREKGTRKKRYLHQDVLQTDKQVDHKNGNGLFNLRSNLRAATSMQNNQNRRKRAGCTSKYKGVSWFSRDGLWTAKITVNKRVIYLGRYTSELAAALVYRKAAKKYFGEFAYASKRKR